MARIAIAQMRDGDMVEQTFILQNKALGTTNNAKLYIKGECGDATGTIHVRMWNAAREVYDRLPGTGYVIVRGRVETYQGHLQLVADGMLPCDDHSKLDLSELLKHTQKNVPEMLARVRAILGLLRDKDLAALIGAFLDDAELMKKFSIAPAAMGMHHAWIGGLLEHTLSLLELALVICPRYPDIDQDLVLAGLFLHDIGKTAELSYTCGFDYTDKGRLLGHAALAVCWIAEKAEKVKASRNNAVRGDLLMVLQHIILSHHGTPEFGAAVTPKTPEAILVNLIDNLDAKTQMAIDAVAAPSEDNTWTEYQKAFGTKLYRPTITLHE